MTGSSEHDLHAALTYATHDGVALQGDLYLPKGAGPFPALVAVHGGGWQQGARNAFQYWGPYLAARGYGMLTISYRLAKKGTKTFPHAVHDVVAAVQFLRANAAQYRLDPERLGLFGASAGGHLAALAALGANAGKFLDGYPGDAQAKESAKVKALIGVYGVYDLVAMWETYRSDSPHRDNNIENFVGASPMDNRQLYFRTRPRSAMRPTATTRPRCCSPPASRTTWSTAAATPMSSCARSSRPASSRAAASWRAPATTGRAIRSTSPAATPPCWRRA